MSWIAQDDAIAAILFAMEHQSISGPLNVTAPNPLPHADLTRALARQLHRPAVLTVPAFALRLIFGAMADEALLASSRVQPAKLLEAGFQFSLPEVAGALKKALK